MNCEIPSCKNLAVKTFTVVIGSESGSLQLCDFHFLTIDTLYKIHGEEIISMMMAGVDDKTIQNTIRKSDEAAIGLIIENVLKQKDGK